MPLDFTKPVTTGNFSTGVLQPINDAQKALAFLLDPTYAGTLTSVPTGAKRLNGGSFEQYNGSSWAAISMNYPTLGGTGATGTWGINITGNAATATSASSASAAPWAGITGKPSLVSETADTAATPSTLVKRDATGYIWGVYLNQASSNGENPTISQVMVTNGADGFLRKASLAHLGASITVPWTSVSSRPTDLASFTNGPGYITASALSPYAVLASAPVFTGMVKGNSGSKGFGAITTTTTTGTPTGGASGDFVFVY